MPRLHKRTRTAPAWAYPSSCRVLLSAALLGTCLFAASVIQAESTVRLYADRTLDTIGATTFDEQGKVVGQSSFEIEAEPDGLRRMRVTLSVEGGGSNVSQALLVPIHPIATTTGEPSNRPEAGQIEMRLVEERSQATRADGVSLPLLVIDHLIGRVSCYPADQDPSAGQHIDLPDEDRVVNVPMQLLFLPLVRGEVDTLRFQIATCAPGPVLHQMIAVRGPTIERDGRDVVEIEYGPDFGKTVAWLASRLLPSFSFWFDARDGAYLGHRMPLHRDGPEILLVRRGLSPPDLGVD